MNKDPLLGIIIVGHFVLHAIAISIIHRQAKKINHLKWREGWLNSNTWRTARKATKEPHLESYVSKPKEQTQKLLAERAEAAIIDIRDKAADVANNGAEERDRFLGRQIILLCEKALSEFNYNSPPSC